MSGHRIADYTETDYAEYWKKPERRYFDALEQPLVRGLIPNGGRWFAELGCGFGRFKDLYLGANDRVVMLDYDEKLLKAVRDSLPGDQRGKVLLVRGDLYNLPLRSGLLDGGMMIRVFHHLETPIDAFREIRRALAPGGTFLFNYYNRRNAREILRRLVTRSGRDPFAVTHENHSAEDMIFYSHPEYIAGMLDAAGLEVLRRRSVGLLYGKLTPLGRLLAPFERALAGPLALGPWGMEVFLETRRAEGEGAANVSQPGDALRCPGCKTEGLVLDDKAATCPKCALAYPVDGGIIDLRPRT